MNKAQRTKQLRKAYELLDRALDLLNEVNDEEQDSLYNWPESLQETDRYYHASDRADAIEARRDELEELRDELENTINEDF